MGLGVAIPSPHLLIPSGHLTVGGVAAVPTPRWMANWRCGSAF